MNKGTALLSCFISGVACFFLGIKYSETKCRKQADAEIKSVIDTFTKKTGTDKPPVVQDQDPKIVPNALKTDSASYEEHIRNAVEKPVTEYDTAVKKYAEIEKNTEAKKKFEIIDAERWMSDPDIWRESKSLRYYMDGTIVDDDDHALTAKEVDDTIGRQNLMEEFKFGALYVRNYDTMTEYEIIEQPVRWCDISRGADDGGGNNV